LANSTNVVGAAFDQARAAGGAISIRGKEMNLESVMREKRKFWVYFRQSIA
jgi:hypothetical protein